MHNNVRKQLGGKSPFNEQKDLLAQRYAVYPLSRKIRIRKSYHPTILLGPTYLPTYRFRIIYTYQQPYLLPTQGNLRAYESKQPIHTRVLEKDCNFDSRRNMLNIVRYG